MDFLPILPELYVTNMENTIHFYVDTLGFKIEYKRDNPKFFFLSYQGSQLMFQELVAGEKEEEQLEHPFGRGINFQIETKSVQTLVDALTNANYPIKRGVKDSWYREDDKLLGCREILVTDPDGYLLRFSEDIGTKDA